jgi:carboxyl-terminal processing protease
MPSKFPKTPVIVVSAVVLVLVGVWWGGHPSYLPGFLQSSLTANDKNALALEQAVDTVVRDYYRPLKRSQVVDSSIAGLVAGLHDQFSNYFTPSEYQHFDVFTSGRFSGVGMEVLSQPRGLLVRDVFDSSPAQKAGIAIGDTVVGAGGHSLAGLSTEAASALIKGPAGTPVALTVRSPDGRVRTVHVDREQVSPVTASRMVNVHGVPLGLVQLTSFSAGAHTQVSDAVHRLLKAGARGLILDLRGNGGGLVDEAQMIASLFVPSGVIVSTRGRTQAPQTLYALGGAIPSKVPMVVLVDGGTASAAEIVTGALQDHRRATVVGTRTFGKGVFQEVEPLANGGALDVTVGEYFTPNGRNLGGGGIKRGAGIIPNVHVAGQPTLTSDPALSAGERVLLAQLGT